jgi:hypothetical protein
VTPRVLLLSILVLASWSPAAAQTQDFTDWIYKRLATLAANGPAAASKQVETPSAATNSTSLVERSGAPDLIGLAMQFFNRGTEEATTPTSITVSAFALRSALLGTEPMRPEVYAAGRQWRRYSVAVGREAAAEELPEAQVVAAKALLWDQRDPTAPANVTMLRQTTARADIGKQFAAAVASLLELIATRLAPRLGLMPFDVASQRLGAAQHAETLALLTDAELAEVDALLREKFVPLMAQAQAEERRLVDRLLRAPQLAVSYQVKLRDDAGNEHQWLGVFDYGLADRLELSVNGGVLRVDVPELGGQTSGRLGVEAQFRVTGGSSTLHGLVRAPMPVVVSVSTANTWSGDAADIHKVQAKVTLPLPGPLNGVALPIALTVANRTELVDERDVRGQLGFTIDFTRLTSALRAGR